jgi:ferrous iron transport protein A
MNAPLPSTPQALTTLDDITPGQSVMVVRVLGPDAIRRRLMEMGLCHGVAVDVLRRAPLGDPIEVRVRGYLLSLRGMQAALIRVSRQAQVPGQSSPHAA